MIYTIVHSKTIFEYLNPRPETILIEDIAHALSNLCRFTGHTRYFFSVAQHSILVSECVSKENRLWGLLHDAPEAYVNDIASPLKKIIKGNYKWIHDNIMVQICSKFGLPIAEPEEVKRIDHIVTINELWALIDSSYESEETEGIPELFDHVECWPPEKAKEEFFRRYDELK